MQHEKDKVIATTIATSFFVVAYHYLSLPQGVVKANLHTFRNIQMSASTKSWTVDSSIDNCISKINCFAKPCVNKDTAEAIEGQSVYFFNDFFDKDTQKSISVKGSFEAKLAACAMYKYFVKNNNEAFAVIVNTAPNQFKRLIVNFDKTCNGMFLSESILEHKLQLNGSSVLKTEITSEQLSQFMTKSKAANKNEVPTQVFGKVEAPAEIEL